MHTGTRNIREDKGYTLVELLVVMAIFTAVAMSISVTFNNLLSKGTQQTRSAMSQIGGVTGLEMLRSDIAHAGFALPWSYPTGFSLTTSEVSGPPVTGLSLDSTQFGKLSETNPLTPPHAVLGIRSNAGGSPPGPYYLVLKSALLVLNSPSIGHWGFVGYSSGGKSYIRTAGDTVSDVTTQDRLITLNVSFDAQGNETRKLMASNPSTFSYALTNTTAPITVPNSWAQPTDPSQSAFVYAISDKTTDPTDLVMPYNRADYYVDFNPALRPQSCNQGTGVLFKAVAGQRGNYQDVNNTPLIYPLLNCVGDMQVVFILDKNGDGQFSSYPPDDSYISGPTGLTADQLRAQLRQVKVYILAHEGGKDTSFSYPGTSIMVGEPGVGGQNWTSAQLDQKFGTLWRNYRWKVYALTVNMLNMQK